MPCFAGNRRMLLANGLALSGSMQKLGDEFAAAGKTPLFFAANRQIVGIFAVADVLKPTSKAAVEALRSMHIDVTLLTGRQPENRAVHRVRAGRDRCDR